MMWFNIWKLNNLSTFFLVFVVEITAAARTFSVDYDANNFLMNGEKFQYVAGSFHYFRALPHVWSDRLRTMRAAGLTVVDTYVEWALHNPRDGEYTFDGIADLENFITKAQEEGLHVILRPGPYICAERDNGGIPYWLFTKYPGIKLRTRDENYLNEVAIWYEKLMSRMQKHLYGNGGPIIMVQVENEYGVSKLCDDVYLDFLKNETEKYVQGNAILFTVDIPNSVEEMRCGKIDGVLATTDFGINRIHEMDAIWQMLRQVQETGPLVNSEFYPGWLTHWQEENQRRSADEVAEALRLMLEANANVNFYMFFGGTNFGFTAGANDWGIGNYMADITSYDYDAVMDEAGNPYPEKYSKVRNVIEEYFQTTINIPTPEKQPVMILDSMIMEPIENLFSILSRKHLGRPHVGLSGSSGGNSVTSLYPQSFEELNQFSGLVLYETDLPTFKIDPSLLTVNDLHDRAFVYVDGHFIGTLSRENAIKSIPINAGTGDRLQILVENQGRINFNVFDDYKGILGSVTIQGYENEQIELTGWTMTGYPLTMYDHIENLINEVKREEPVQLTSTTGVLREGPIVYYTEFTLSNTMDILDTYFDPVGWGKGVLYVNGFNLGRYWPLVGPQITMYVPKDVLRPGVNRIVLVEYQKSPLDLMIKFTDEPRLDG